MGRGQDTTSIDVSDELARDAASSEDGAAARSGGDQVEPPNPADETLSQSGLPAAFELIAEACAAVKIAEDRASLAEGALEDVELFYAQQIEELIGKLGAADRRAETAERHAAQAEERLRIFCQTILTTMHNIDNHSIDATRRTPLRPEAARQNAATD